LDFRQSRQDPRKKRPSNKISIGATFHFGQNLNWREISLRAKFQLANKIPLRAKFQLARNFTLAKISIGAKFFSKPKIENKNKKQKKKNNNKPKTKNMLKKE